MRFNSAIKGLKSLKTPVTGVLNNLNNSVLNVIKVPSCTLAVRSAAGRSKTGTIERSLKFYADRLKSTFAIL